MSVVTFWLSCFKTILIFAWLFEADNTCEYILPCAYARSLKTGLRVVCHHC